MKILFLSDNFPPEVNAIASRVFERARHWARWGHEVTIITSAPNFPEGKVHEGYENRWRQVEIIDGIRVVRVKTFIAPNEGFLLRTIDFLSYMITAPWGARSEPTPDVVAATSPQIFVAVAGFIVARLKRKPFVMEVGDLWPASIIAVNAMKPGLIIRLLEKLELFLYRRAVRVILLTKAFRENLIRRNIPADKLDVVRNGVELSYFQSRSKDIQLARSFGLKDEFVIGYIGTHGMAHNLSNVIKAAEQTRNDKNILYLFVGSGAEKRSLVALAEEKKLSNVIFLPSQPKAAMPSIWSVCDVALAHLRDSPTMREVVPSKMFEAMGMALPILLVAPEGEASQILTETGAGIHVPAGRPKALAEAVRELSRNPELMRRLSERSRAAAPKHSREEQARLYLDSLSRACDMHEKDRC